MTPEELAALNGHITGEIHAAYDDHGIYDDNPREGMGVIVWIAVAVVGALFVVGLVLQCG